MNVSDGSTVILAGLWNCIGLFVCVKTVKVVLIMRRNFGY